MRYLALTDNDRLEMLQKVGVSNIDELYKDVDKDVLNGVADDLPDGVGEIEVERQISALAKKNHSANDGPFFLGAGCYNHHVPSAVDHIIQRAEYLTSYTPYQPEISQGTLAVIFEFQNIISKLTGMEVANASMYDGATSLAEAVLMALRIKRKAKNIHIFNDIHPDYRKVLNTYVEIAGAEIIDNIDNVDSDSAAIIVAYPSFEGNIDDLNDIRKKCDEAGVLMIVCVSEILSLGVLDAPKMADIVVGEASSIGVAMSFGGPHLGFFACAKKNVRQIPGRICGFTVDGENNPAYVLTLNAREQHIRREKATSNICSNQGLMATAFTIHANLLGEIGFKKLSLINHKKACDLADALSKVNGVKIVNDNFYNEFVIEVSRDANFVLSELLKNKIIGGLEIGQNKILVAATELNSVSDIEQYQNALNKILN